MNKIWVWDEFQKVILYCTHPQQTSSRPQQPGKYHYDCQNGWILLYHSDLKGIQRGIVRHFSNWINSTLPGQNGSHFAGDIFRCIFVNEKFGILIKISLKLIPMGPIVINTALVKIMAWRWLGDKPLSEPMLTRLTDAYMWHWAEIRYVRLVKISGKRSFFGECSTEVTGGFPTQEASNAEIVSINISYIHTWATLPILTPCMD